MGTRNFAIILSNFYLKKSEGCTVFLDERLHLKTCHGPIPVIFSGTAKALLKNTLYCLERSRICSSALGTFFLSFFGEEHSLLNFEANGNELLEACPDAAESNG